MFLMITGLIWLATGAVLYRSERKLDPDTRFDRSTRAEGCGAGTAVAAGAVHHAAVWRSPQDSPAYPQ